MSEHQTAIDAIEQADSHTEIRSIVRGYSAAALDPDAHSLLYSGQIPEPPPAAGVGSTASRDVRRGPALASDLMING